MRTGVALISRSVRMGTEARRKWFVIGGFFSCKMPEYSFPALIITCDNPDGPDRSRLALLHAQY